jgi:uncharacterized protein YjdB
LKRLHLALVTLPAILLQACSGLPRPGSSNTSGSGAGGGSATATLTSISVTPASTSVNTSATQAFTATGHYSDNTTKDLTSTAKWSSSNSGVASVSTAGVAMGVTAGSATITAASGTIQGTASLTVNSAGGGASGPTLTSISITPQITSIAVNTTQQLAATGSYSDGSSKDITTVVAWNSSSGVVASVDVNGLLTGVAAGSATITATLGTVTQSLAITVNAPTITSISVSPGDLTMPIGVSQKYVATAIYSDGSSADLTSGVTWSSSASAVASVDSTGLATTLAEGTTTVTASAGGFTDSSTLTVVAAHLQSITVSPATATMAIGTLESFTATGAFDDGSTQLLTSVSWSSSATNLLGVNSSGVATAIGAGTITVTASSGGISGTASVTVTAATLVSITLSPANSSMPIGATKQFTATGKFSDNSTQDITLTAIWSSSSATVATTNDQGLVTSMAAGSATISAASGSISGSTGLTVSTAKLTSITVNPASAHIAKGTSVKFTASGNYSDGSTVTNLLGVSWKSSKPQFASIRSSGIAHGKRAGTVTITASLSGISGTASLVIGSGTLVSVAISPINPTIAVGATEQFTATGTFSDATTQDVTLNSHWSSSKAAVATIANAPSIAGLANASGTGLTTIGVNSGGIQGSTSLTVQ